MAEDAPLISVCLPVYNAERYIAEAVESILGQTLGDFELLILDDGSTDGSLEILRRYVARDPRIRLTSRPNKGLVTSLNELIDQSRGEFLARMDADDIALPQRFARQVEYLRTHPECVLAGCRVRVIDPDGDPMCDWCTKEQHEAIDASYLGGERTTAICHPAFMMRRDVVLALGRYRPFEVAEDIDLVLRLAECGRITNMQEVLLQYRMHTTNISTAASYRRTVDRVYGEIIRDARRRRNLPEAGDPPAGPAVPAQPHIDPSPIEEREKWAWWALVSGHLKTARKHARWVLTRTPLSPRSWKLLYCVLRGY
jgi:glycosyltransferase involved in cell wall biosynthesis